MRQLFIITLGLLLTNSLFSQGFLHADGKYIYNGNGEEVILRGIGTGNWMIQEGYMMKTSDVANTQHEIRTKLIATIGEAKTDSFYTAWLQNHMTRADVDSMKAWGFNSIRVALHYMWFTPPIEDEPVPGEITWLDKGFEMVDSLVKWCTDNQMYLILDMHATPGGQGKDAAISDYDPAKPALWQSQDNKNKLVALWKKLADRYKDEPWVGGYDLINETNWTFTEANNKPLWDIFKAITTAIREVDVNHLIILEGNSFANDYNGIPTLWDDNLALSFHKYWSYTDENSLDWIIALRNQKNVPIWLGESGENSNTWFTSLISLAERNNIGWSWWPVKKNSINNILNATVNADYLNLIKYWAGTVSKPTVDAAFQAVLTWADNQKFENCHIQYDVIDAMIRQPFSSESLPSKKHTTDQPIFAVDYDFGRNNVAYYDMDTANYNSSTGTYINWNQGWSYRNDGVDIEGCTDSEVSNGYNVGWTAVGEWLLYTVNADSIAGYTLNIRYASGSAGGTIRIEIDGVSATEKFTVPGTGGWQKWQTKQFNDFIFPAGSHKLKFIFETGGINLNYFKLTNPVSIDPIDFRALDAQTTDGDTINLFLNKEITADEASIVASEFDISINGIQTPVTGIKINALNKRVLKIVPESTVYYGDLASLSYSGSSVTCGVQNLPAFTDMEVRNLLPVRYTVPVKIQVEDYHHNYGFQFETCTDAGGGFNTSYANPGDYLDYLIYVAETGEYTFNYRVATTASNARLEILTDYSGSFTPIDTLRINSTGGWQAWKTQTSNTLLQQGRYTLRLKVIQGEQNLNWLEILNYSATKNPNRAMDIKVFPNPTSDFIYVEIPNSTSAYQCSLSDITGKLILKQSFDDSGKLELNIQQLNKGLYFIEISTGSNKLSTVPFIKN